MSLLSKNVGQTTIGTGPTTSPFAKSCRIKSLTKRPATLTGGPRCGNWHNR